jgi:hypothetical protein
MSTASQQAKTFALYLEYGFKISDRANVEVVAVSNDRDKLISLFENDWGYKNKAATEDKYELLLAFHDDKFLRKGILDRKFIYMCVTIKEVLFL